MTENPYSSPPIPSAPVAAALADAPAPSLQQIARETFLAWEKLRILYVAILVAVTIAFTGPSGLGNRRLLLLIVEGAIVANIAFFAGPLVDSYVRWLGYGRSWPRWVLFLGGTLLSIILAVGLLATELLPSPA